MAPHPPGPPAPPPVPGSAPSPPSPSEAVPRCARPKPSGAIRSGCAFRARSCRRLCPIGLCPLPSGGPWRPRSARCGGQPGEALLARRGLSPTRHRTRPPAQHRLPFAHRMKSLEQDALRAQMVLSKSQEGRSRRGPLERLAEAPSPAPTPSPTPGEGLWPGQGGGWGTQPRPFPTPASCPPRPGAPDQHLPWTPGEEPAAVARPAPLPRLSPPLPSPSSHSLPFSLTLSFQGLIWEEV